MSAKLRNEHITRVIDVGMWREKYPFMVMDLLVGEDLRVLLRKSPGGRLATGIALDYIVQVCEGLAEAHSHGIVHRDLKPSNLFVIKRLDGLYEVVLTRNAQDKPYLVPRLESGFFGIRDGEGAAAAISKVTG